MQETYSSMLIQLNTHFWRSSRNLEVSKARTRYASFIFNYPVCIVQNTHCIIAWFSSLPHCRTNNSDNDFWTGDKLEIGDQQAWHQSEHTLWNVWFLCWLAKKWGGSTFQRNQLIWFTLLLLWNQSSAEDSSPPLWQECAPACWIYPTRAAECFVAGNLTTTKLILATHIFWTRVSTNIKCNQSTFLVSHQYIEQEIEILLPQC